MHNSFSRGRTGGHSANGSGQSRPAKFHRPKFKGPSNSRGPAHPYGGGDRGPATSGPTTSGPFGSQTRFSGSRSSSSSTGRSSFGGASRGGYSSGSRGRSGGYGGSRGGSRGSRFQGQRIDISKFINKAVITEEVQVFVPEHKFSDFQIDQKLKDSIQSRGYIDPTPIQDRSIPHILRGEDIVGIANTGTGKTGAFLIPLIHKVLTNPKENVLIVVPTRELAIQIEQELKLLTGGKLGIFSVCCVGGASIGAQISALRYKNQFIIGTPGRLKDLIERQKIKLAEFNTIVLDEADRMLDMGFINDMRFMMDRMPKERHTLFFSATLSPDIERLINDFLRTPVRISVKTGDTSKSVDQDIVKVSGGLKIEKLVELLSQPEFSKVLIFGRTKHGVEKLSKILETRGIAVDCIHGDKTHNNRQRALRAFKDHKIKALIATDVAARGLDIPNVTHVINYDIPATHDDYVHRIGRTGRGGKLGKALTFIETN